MQVLRAARSLLPANRNRVQPLVGKLQSLLHVVPLAACFRCVASFSMSTGRAAAGW
jgi:hypothetical protein